MGGPLHQAPVPAKIETRNCSFSSYMVHPVFATALSMTSLLAAAALVLPGPALARRDNSNPPYSVFRTLPQVARGPQGPRGNVDVPGPLPIAGVAAAALWSRKLRKTVKLRSAREC